MEADRGAQSICTERDRVSGINSHKGAMVFLVVLRHSKTEAARTQVELEPAEECVQEEPMSS